ncbi:MAG: hypothetical protein PPHEINF_5783 [uncultured Paraburkholderia sp.]|nr:MAG: hypothetical protein PPHEINF_5783 [uncultured Paraburkholderia sp.]CAH2807928.1 MAG: hypothetical protein PPHEESC_5878 [uncultured Paraburkholderia sp.]CAH2942672.1 MAG: hypothetical protein PPHEMADMSA_5807 [uncultured Paraburkholderia sp.]CAH2943764.1 MAG: hypothetical protein PPHERAN_5851 [uncultured Paraburkholderia sp.]
MAERKVQQFDPVEDDFLSGELHTLDLTDGELRTLAEAEAEPVLSERLNGFCTLLRLKQDEQRALLRLG